MISSLAVAILIIVLAAIVLFSLLKSALKAAISLAFLLFVGLIVVGFLFVQDAGDFKEVFSKEPSIYILEYQDELVTAFSLVSMNLSTFEPVSIDDALIYIADEGPGKIFVMNKDILNASIDDKLSEMIGVGFEEGLSSEDNTIRASSFFVSLIATFEEQKTTYAFSQVRDGEMVILPRSFSVKVLTFDAKSYVDKVKTIVDNNKDSINDIVDLVNESKNLLDVNITI